MGTVSVMTPRGKKNDHRQVVKAKEMYAQGEMPEEMVWDICTYLKIFGTTKADKGLCKECPRWEKERVGGKTENVQRGCFGLAHEAAATALAWSKRITNEGRK